jgi:hypothetical protein
MALLSFSAHSQVTQDSLTQAVSKANGSATERIEYVEFILANHRQANSTQLFFAARNALQSGRIEDAGFLFYAAQLRAKLDFFRYPSANAQQALGAVRQVMSEAIDPVIIRDPNVYEKIFDRIKTWEIVPLEDYSPGWDSNAKKTPEEIKSAAASIKQGLVEYMGNGVTLFRIPAYHKAVMTVQSYNFPSSNAKSDATTRADYESALSTIRDLEKDRGISYLGGK